MTAVYQEIIKIDWPTLPQKGPKDCAQLVSKGLIIRADSAPSTARPLLFTNNLTNCLTNFYKHHIITSVFSSLWIRILVHRSKFILPRWNAIISSLAFQRTSSQRSESPPGTFRIFGVFDFGQLRAGDFFISKAGKAGDLFRKKCHPE